MRVSHIVAALATLAVAARAEAGPGLFNTDKGSLGWYIFKGPIVLPRFNVPPTYALTQLEIQRAGAGYSGLAGYYPIFGWGYGPYPPAAIRWGYRGIEPPLPPPPSPPEFRAHLTVAVPADAEVWLEGVATQQTGPTRQFVSPDLEPGSRYGYTIRARWRDGDTLLEQTQEIVVRPGEQLNVTFPLPR